MENNKREIQLIMMQQEFDSIQSWPIFPTFISLTSDFQDQNILTILESENYYNPNRHGIYDASLIREFLAVTSLDFGKESQFPLFQVVPKDFDLGKDKKYFTYIDIPKLNIFNDLRENFDLIKIDSSDIVPPKSCCYYFKNCKRGKESCNFHDSRALLFYHKELSGINYEDRKLFRKKLSNICELYNQEANLDDKFKVSACIDKDKHVYLKYVCSISCLEEFIFPIIVNKRIIATLCFGSRTLNKDSFCEKDMFKDYRGNDDDFNHIIEDFSKSMNNSVDFNVIFDRISIFEQRITDSLLKRANEIVSSKIEQIEEKFRKQIEPIIPTSISEKESSFYLVQDKIDKYSTILNNALNEICVFFDKDAEIRAYTIAPRVFGNYDNVEFNLICDSNKCLREEHEIVKQINFRIGINELDTFHNQNLASYVSYPENFAVSDKEFFSTALFSTGKNKVLLWGKFSEWIKDFPLQYGVLQHYLKSCFHSFIEPYYILITDLYSALLKNTISITSHETSQILTPMRDSLYKAFELNTLENLIYSGGSRVSYDDTINLQTRTAFDTCQRIELLDHLYSRSYNIGQKVSPKYEEVDLHRIIYSIKSIFDDTARNEEKCIQVEMDPSLDKFNILTDKKLLSHIIFNLIDNAIKYSFRGSIIRIKVWTDDYDQLSNDNVNSLTIEISDYGEGISQDDTKVIFNLFNRGSKESKKNTAGKGIGLYLVRQFCDGLSYHISCKSLMIATYNLPYYAYLSKQKITESLSLSKESRDILLQAHPSQDTIEQVAWKTATLFSDSRFPNNSINAHLPRPTYKNTFTIQLNPQSGSNLLIRKK